MATLLLIIIYLSFISLGLPDAMLGSAWPIMQKELSAATSFAGVVSMIISCGTIISSLMCVRLVKKMGTGMVTVISVALTAISLLGMSFTQNAYFMCVLAIPMGLGAGAVDSALNNFVALHYKANHMSWLHCFWGLGATGGPMLMSVFLKSESGWRGGYLTTGIIQSVLVLTLIISLPVWKSFTSRQEDEQTKSLSAAGVLRMKGAKPALLVFFCYCAVELATGLWGSTYLVNSRGIDPAQAARFVSYYYLGITVGRLITGFITMKIKNSAIIRMGLVIIAAGTILFMLPLGSAGALIAMMLIGFGCAPVYPCMIHETPRRFGKEFSQSMIGIQMAVAYTGSTLMPPLCGFIAQHTSASSIPVFLCTVSMVMLFSGFYLTRDNVKR